MNSNELRKPVKLSLVIPCFNEAATLEKCLERVLDIQGEDLSLEIIIVDDGSRDDSLHIARQLAVGHPEVLVLSHEGNRGKGAALRTGFGAATGDFVAVQDADLEYNPRELLTLLGPLVDGTADVVFGSRFLTSGPRRVLYFWHYLGNTLLTFLSNMFSDLNLSDMETCYKVFRRDVIQSITIEEDRFGVEPELTAKVARMRLRVYEIGISYYGRTYQEGKKIGLTDGFRALYCIFHYNAPTAPWPVQLLIYFFIGGLSALFNLVAFSLFIASGLDIGYSIAAAYLAASVVNYLLCISLLFRHKARWNSMVELVVYLLIVCSIGFLDFGVTSLFMEVGFSPLVSKIPASFATFILNFLGRRVLVFPEPEAGRWKAQTPSRQKDS